MGNKNTSGVSYARALNGPGMGRSDVGGPGTQEAFEKVVNLSIHRWKSDGEMSRGKVEGSAVADILIHLLTSGLGVGPGGGTYTAGGVQDFLLKRLPGEPGPF